ncbi:hypothetical protein [Demequina sp. NBRC 110053]|uniref:hypothetical protein n=1 Tax=Demequina sp. NBRC 110053 TaxID=1570342 RepID=UPI000A06210E|nr:hypothetical protein [Demequina sp. NBRC 110053]
MNLHDELGRVGADATAGSSERLTSVETADALGTRVRRGRRRRAAAGVGSVAAVALVAVGVWSVLPGFGGALEPASSPSPSSEGDAVSDGRAELRAPEGDSYQAFVVPEPDVGCAPFGDLAAAGAPHEQSVQYEVELPGVADRLTGELWGAEPVLTLPAAYEPWYVGLDAWLVADVVSAGIQDPHLEWTSLSVGGWALSPGGVDAVHGADCAYVQPIPKVEGAMFLVLDGVDQQSVSEVAPDAYWSLPADGLQTWVYLGEAAPGGATEGGEPVEEPSSEELPALGEEGYLTQALGARPWTGGLGCSAVLDGTAGPGSDGETLYDVVIPSWLETGRLYGYGNDALVGGYPIPVMPGMSGELARTDPDEARLVLRDGVGAWVFSVAWSERDDLPHDPEALFVELNQIWDCGSGDLIEPGSYAATLIRPGADGLEALDLTPITVVDGVPSIPELDEG